MPREATKFGVIQECLDLRKAAHASPKVWIGQSADNDGDIDQGDQDNCYHIVNSGREGAVGYARLKPVLIGSHGNECEASNRVAEAARVSNRLPAFELQKVSVADATPSMETPGEGEQSRGDILKQLFIEAFRVCNANQARFIFTACDRGGSEELRHLGIRYSTLSVPFVMKNRLMVVLCVPVTNSNFNSLSPLRVVGGTQMPSRAVASTNARERCVEDPTVFDKLEALAELVADSGSDTDQH